MGAGVWFGEDDKQKVFLWLPGPFQTNNAAKIRAVLESVLAAIETEVIMTISNSKYVIEGLCFHLKQWEDNGCVGVSNSDVWKATVAIICKWSSPVYFQWVKGHSGDTRNEEADLLAEKDAHLDEEEALPADTEINHEFNINGAKLSSLTQSWVYKLLHMLTEMEERPSAHVVKEQVIAMVKEINGVALVPSRIWKPIHHKDISWLIRGYLWKALQNLFKIGSF